MSYQPAAPGLPIATLFPDLDTLAAEAMAEWKIPGLAIAVVRNDEVPLLKAYGHRDVEAGLPVTTDTHFTICSITKSFTSTGLALLVEEGRLDWTKPVRDYVPEFRLKDAVATDRITVRDLLCHQSGLPRHDWIWMPADLSRAQMLSAMRHLEPSRDIREAFQYNNLGYNVAGIVAERISGSSWEEFTRARLTDKLHMTVSFTPEELASTEDAATPYAMNGDIRLRARLWPIRTTAAGGINTSVADIANWLRLHLGKGVFEGQRLLSSPLVRELQSPRVHVSNAEFAEIGDSHYGLGFGSHTYRGERVVSHGGGWVGWSTLMSMLPERGIGVAVFTNRAPSPVTDILTNYIFDRHCGKEPVSWFDRFRERRRKFLAQMDTDRQAQKPYATRARDQAMILPTISANTSTQVMAAWPSRAARTVCIGPIADFPRPWRIGTTTPSSCPKSRSACIRTASPSPSRLIAMATSQAFRPRSSPWSRISSSSVSRPANAWTPHSANRASAGSAMDP